MTNTFFDKLLDYYHISQDEYEELQKEQTLETFSLGHSFKDISKTKDIVLNAIKNKKRILIYGDYDADGIMGASILVKMFQYLNYEVKYYIPSRYIDGYGLTIEKSEKCIGKFDLVITVDNGITANEAIDILKKNNIEVVVIDHHTVQLPLPNADAIVHPEVSKYGDIATSGAYSAFMFSREVLGYYDKYLATLASISLISDMMPLKEYNRKLLKAVFKDYIDNEFIQISLLAEHKTLDEKVIGLSIAPKINAIGRIIEDKSVNNTVKYFVSDDKEFILTYFDYMTRINEERKNITKEVSNTLLTSLDETAMVSKVDVKEGIIGLIAGNISNKLKKPAIVFAKDKDGNLKASARSVEGFNIVDAFKSLDKYMLAYGGHALAGGCSIKESDFESFKQDFVNLVNSSDIHVEEKPSIDISINDITLENYQIYRSFAPFGEAWKAPLLSIKHIKTDALLYSKSGEHILTKIGTNSKLVGFNISKDSLYRIPYIDTNGTLDTSTFKNLVTVEFHISEYKASN